MITPLLILFVLLVIGCVVTLIGLGIMRGSAREQAHYEQIYGEYIAKQDKRGVHLN